SLGDPAQAGNVFFGAQTANRSDHGAFLSLGTNHIVDLRRAVHIRHKERCGGHHPLRRARHHLGPRDLSRCCAARWKPDHTELDDPSQATGRLEGSPSMRDRSLEGSPYPLGPGGARDRRLLAASREEANTAALTGLPTAGPRWATLRPLSRTPART